VVFAEWLVVLGGSTVLPWNTSASQTDDRQIHPHRNMTAVSIGKYCQFIIIFTKYWENINTYTPTLNFGDHPHAPLNFPAMLADLSVEVIGKAPSRYYRVPQYFFTVQSVVPPNTTVLQQWEDLRLSLSKKLNSLTNVFN